MSSNTFGTIFTATTFGESHGVALGVIVNGCPAGVPINVDFIQRALDRRKPGVAFGDVANIAVTSRKESDKVELLSGVFEGISEGTPIALLIRNTSQHSADYDNLKNTFRPGHADLSYYIKYGNRDYRGGGRASGRETAARVAAGAIAQMFINYATNNKCKIKAYTKAAAGITYDLIDEAVIEKNAMRAANILASKDMLERIAQARKSGDSVGGIVECRVSGVPQGLGEPVFDKLDARLSSAMLGIGAVKGIEFGDGFALSLAKGSSSNDTMHAQNGSVAFSTNHAGGIYGGISVGSDIIFRLAIKPVPSIFLSQHTVAKTASGTFTDCDLVIQGRHDVCLCPRIVPVVEAMTALTLADMLLLNRSAKA